MFTVNVELNGIIFIPNGGQPEGLAQLLTQSHGVIVGKGGNTGGTHTRLRRICENQIQAAVIISALDGVHKPVGDPQ